jgi:hypothetical protein
MSEATQLGQILSQIDAYSGFRTIQEGCKHVKKWMIAGINNDWLRKRSPQVTACGTSEEKLNVVRRVRTHPGKDYLLGKYKSEKDKPNRVRLRS